MNNEPKLDRLLEHLEAAIDEKQVAKAVKRNHDAIHFRPVDHVPLAIGVQGSCGWEPVPREMTYDNPELMLYNELLYSFGSVVNSVAVGDDFLYQVRSNHGVGIIASQFGANCRIVNGMPWVDHLEHGALRATVDKGLPSPESGLGGKVLQTVAWFSERLKEYPVCSRTIRISQPDLQGPFDIAHLLMGPDIFYALYDEPEFVHELLELITDAYIQFAEAVKPYLTCEVETDSLVVHGSLYGGHAVIKDDTAAVNISQDSYNEFSARYNKDILHRLGGASLHHCGLEREWHFESFADPLLLGVNYGQPQFHMLETKLENARKHRIPIIGWGHDLPWDSVPMQDFYRLLPTTGLTLTCTADSVNEARKILHTHRERCRKAKENVQ